MTARTKPPCRCHWPVSAGVFPDGDTEYVYLYCGASLFTPAQLVKRKARAARLKELLLAAQQNEEEAS